MKTIILAFTFFVCFTQANAQLNRYYFNLEGGLQPHVQAASVFHFKHNISLNAGFNFESINTGHYNYHYGAMSIKKHSAIRTDFIGVQLLPGISTNRNKKFDLAVFAGPTYGRYVDKFNFIKNDNGSDGYNYSYSSKDIYQFGFMGRVDLSFQFSKYFGLNIGVGGIAHNYFQTFFASVGFIVGKVRNN
jgi:hypothetical protein